MAKCAVIVCGVVFAAFFLYAHAEIGADLDERMSVGRSLLGDDSFTDSWKEFDAAHQQEKEKKDSKGPRPCPPPVNINANNNRGGDGGQTGDGGDGGAGGGGGGGGGSADGGDAVVIGVASVCKNQVVVGGESATGNQNTVVQVNVDGRRRLLRFTPKA